MRHRNLKLALAVFCFTVAVLLNVRLSYTEQFKTGINLPKALDANLMWNLNNNHDDGRESGDEVIQQESIQQEQEVIQQEQEVIQQEVTQHKVASATKAREDENIPPDARESEEIHNSATFEPKDAISSAPDEKNMQINKTSNISETEKMLNFSETDSKNTSLHTSILRQNTSLTKPSSPEYLFWVKKGRLGNFLCQFAGTYCLALKSGRIHTIEKENEYRHLFPNIPSFVQDYVNLETRRKLWQNKTLSHLYVKYGLSYHPFILEYAQNHSGHLAFSYYFECWQYYEGCGKEIREALQFEPSTQAGVNKIISYFRDSYVQKKKLTAEDEASIKYISVHIRRTDRTVSAPPAMYFVKAINTFREMYTHPLFFITTDDLPWWQQVITNHSLSTEYIYTSHNGPEQFMEDFVLLASCNHSIISSGTFGWFAAWIHGGSTMVYGKRWSKSRCFTMPHWIPIFVD